MEVGVPRAGEILVVWKEALDVAIQGFTTLEIYRRFKSHGVASWMVLQPNEHPLFAYPYFVVLSPSHYVPTSEYTHIYRYLQTLPSVKYTRSMTLQMLRSHIDVQTSG